MDLIPFFAKHQNVFISLLIGSVSLFFLLINLSVLFVLIKYGYLKSRNRYAGVYILACGTIVNDILLLSVILGYITPSCMLMVSSII